MKVLYLANPLQTSTGGDRRSFEVLQRVGRLGVEPVIVVDDFVLQKMRLEGNPLLKKHKIYSVKRPNVVYQRYFRSASRAALDYSSIFWTARLIHAIAQKEHAQLIVSHHEKIDFMLESYLAAQKCRVPWTCLFQLPLFPPYASSAWRPVRGGRRLYMLALYSRLYRLVAEALQSTVTLSVSPSIEVETKSYLGGLNIKMFVLRPGVGVDNKKIQSIAAAQDKVDVFSFSRLTPEKGIYDLPQIASAMKQSKLDLKFLVGGKFDAPSFRVNYDRLVAKHQVGDCLIYKGFLGETQLYSLVKAAKVLLYPSRHDAFPLVVLETLSCGTPVVAYKIPAITSNFPAGAVKTVPVGDCQQMAEAALKILGDADLRQGLSRKALAFTAEYSWEKVAAAEVEAYAKVTGNFKRF